jgi:hypothetical protein
MLKYRDRISGFELNTNFKPRNLALRQILGYLNFDEEKYYVFILMDNKRETLRI